MSVQHYLLRKSITRTNHPNIFMTQHDQDESHMFKDKKIISYHIVGKPEIIDKKLNNSPPIVEQEKKVTKIKPKTYNEQKKQMSQQLNQQEELEFIQIDMEPSQVENEIQQALHKQYQTEHYPLNRLSKADKAAADKDHKIINSFEKQQQSWQRRIISSAQQCRRPVSQSIYKQIDAEREKIEDRQLLDLIQTDAERHGNKLWERQLRSSSDVVETNMKILEKGHEIIRKSNEYSLYKRPRSFAQRFEDRQDKISKLITNQKAENLQIEGNNVLAKETESLFKLVKEEKMKKQELNNIKSSAQIAQAPNSKRKYQAAFKKILPVEKLNESQEIISMNYDKQILRQQGKLDIYKQFF